MKKRILVVDDDLSVRESLKKVLEASGYSVAVAADGGEGQSKLEDGKIDLLILDLNMPHRDGWDVLEDVGAAQPLLPVIVITGMIDQLATTMIAGVAALIQKPIDAPAMLKKIEELVNETPEARLHRITSSSATEGWQRISGRGPDPAERIAFDHLNRIKG